MSLDGAAAWDTFQTVPSLVNAKRGHHLGHGPIWPQRNGNSYHNRAISTMQVIEELIKFAKDLDTATKAGMEMGLTDDEKAYDALAANESAVTAMGDNKLKLIAAELITQVKKSVTIDWTLRESARAKIRVMVKRILNKYG